MPNSALSKIISVYTNLKLKFSSIGKYIQKRVLRIKAIEIVQIFIYAVTICAFLLGLDLFSKESSLGLKIIAAKKYVSPVLLADFYQENQFSIPTQIKPLFEHAKENEEFFKKNEISASNKSIFNYLKLKKEERQQISGGNIDSFLKANNIPQLEHLLTEDRHDLFGFYAGDNFFDFEAIRNMTDKLKKTLATEEYFIWLSAFNRAKVINQELLVKNTGGIDLKDIKIIIPSPYSFTVQSSVLNILDISVYGPETMNTHKLNESDAIIEIPLLKKGGSILFRIKTREEPINKEGIYYSFSSLRLIDKYKALKSLAWIVPMLFFMFLLFKMKLS